VTAIVKFKENRATLYGLPKFQKTLTGEVVSQNAKIISIIPLRCAARKVRNINRTDLEFVETF
jgi:ethanolamine ammonia-lyase large subunit